MIKDWIPIKNFKILVSFVVIATSCTSKNTLLTNKCIDNSITYQKVDINELLDNPFHFDNKYVDVKGIYYHGFEESSLVGRRGESAECIYVLINNDRDLDVEIDNMKYVSKIRIKGKIDITKKGHLEGCKLGIKDICYFEIIN